MKKVLAILSLWMIARDFTAQITVTLQCSKDAAIGYHDGAGTSGNNYGGAIQNAAYKIPAYADPSGYNGNRALIDFNLLSLPPNVTITSAVLNLHGLGPAGSLQGHLGNANSCYLQRITQNWGEYFATWNNQPASTTQNQVQLQQSTSSTQSYLNINVTALVQDMINNPSAGYGFLLRLVNEASGNGMLFASRNHGNPNMHPTLVITYEVCTTPGLTTNAQPASICNGGQLSLMSSGGSNTLWYASNTSQTVLATDSTYMVTATAAGTHTFYAVSGICPLGTRTPVIFTVNPLPTVNISTSNTVICQGSSFTLSATGANSYTWNNGQQTIGQTFSLSSSPTITSTYYVSGTDFNGCNNNSQITVTVNPIPVLTGPNAIEVCAGSSATLSVTGATSYTWTFGSQPIGSGPTVIVSPVVNTLYQVVGKDSNGCVSLPKQVQAYVLSCTNTVTNVGIEEELKDNTSVLIYPNPARSSFTISSSRLFNKIEITDVQGKIIKTIVLPADQNSFEIKNLQVEQGIYFCRILHKNQTLSAHKIVVSN